MNLTQIGRHLRKMVECLSHPQPEPEEARLAKEYAELCAQANQRLLQCASMLDAGDSHQALQLAEVSPPLLDLVTLLAFKQMEEWRARCRNHHLPVAESLDSRSIKSLNAAYNKGIAANAPLYKDYREAMMKNDDARAMAVLRMIVRLNPGDTNAAKELKNLEETDLAARLSRLAASIQAADQKAMLEQIQDIESRVPGPAADNTIWRQAQAVRCKLLLRELHDLRRQEVWPECLALLGQIGQIRDEFSLGLGAEFARETGEIEHWARQQAQEQAREETFARIVDELGLLLDSGRLGFPSRLSLEELKKEMSQLGDKRRELDQFSQKIPPELESRFNEAMQNLRISIHKQAARHRTTLRLGIASGAAVVIICGLVFFQWRRQTVLAGTLKNLAENQQVAAMERLLASLRNQYALSPAFAAARQNAEAYLKLKLNAADECAQEVAGLNSLSEKDLAGTDPEQIYRQQAAALKAIETLSTDARTDPRFALAPFDKRWSAFLSREASRRSAKFAGLFMEAQSRARQAAQSSWSGVPDGGEQKVMALASTLDGLAGSSIPALQLDGTTAERYQNFREQWGAWRSINEALRSPESQAAYLNALRRMPSCQYFATKPASSAAAIASLDLSPLRLKAAVIMPGGELQKWTNYIGAERSLLYPADVRPAEKAVFLELRDDEQIHQVWQYSMDKDNFEPLKTGGNHTVYAIGPIVTKANQQQGRIYDPTASPASLKFKNVTCYTDKTHFNEEGLRPLEYLAYEKIGPNNLIDSKTGAYQKPLLGLLDDLNQETNSSALFRAFLAAELYKIMDVRPVDWGYIWTPAAAADRARLLDLGADRIRSGNWFVPLLIRADSGRFEKFFESARQTSYMRQARFYQTLAQRLAAADFAYAGYVHPERGLVTTAKGNPLWGFDAGRKFVALYRSGTEAGKYNLTCAALPFTPVFCFAQDCTMDVEQACQAAGLDKTAPSIAACPLIAGQ